MFFKCCAITHGTIGRAGVGGVALALFAATALSARAGGPLACRSGCGGKPSIPVFSFEGAAADFKAGRSPMMPRLTGEWFQTGMVRLAGFPDNSFPDELVESGIRNPDGSIKSIFFMPLTGSDGHDVESVTFLNIGSRNADQGPFPVQARPDGACFAQWPYYGPNQVAHYDYECRLTAAGHPPLLCEIAFYADRLSGLPPDWRPYSGRIVYYASFIPKPPPACTPGSMPFACTRSK